MRFRHAAQLIPPVVLGGVALMLAGCSAGIFSSSAQSGAQSDSRDESESRAQSINESAISVALTDASTAETQSGAVSTLSPSSGDGPPSGSAPPSGSSAEIEGVQVTHSRIEVHHAEQGWFAISTDTETTKLSATGRVNEFMNIGELPDGEYSQIRLTIESAEATVNGSEEAVTVPSGALKLVEEFRVKAGYLTELTLVFDAQESIVVAGASGKVLLKPVVKLDSAFIPRFQARVNGGTFEVVTPESSQAAVEDYYDYRFPSPRGPVRSLVTPRVGKIFLYEEQASGELYVIFLTQGRGVQLNLDLSIDGNDDISDLASVPVSDESGELSASRDPEATWNIVTRAIDGGVLDIRPESWEMTARLLRERRMRDWVYHSADGNQLSAGTNRGATITLRRNF